MTGKRTKSRGRSARWSATLALLGLAAPIGELQAQDLPLRTSPPPVSTLVCDTVNRDAVDRRVRARDAAGAEQLIHAATRAMLLGDLEGALESLDRALVADPAAAEAAYLQARIHERQGQSEAATAALCRYLRLDPAGPSADDVRRRLDEIGDRGAGARLLGAYRRGLDLEQEGRLEEAEAAFTEVIEARPAATMALYNRAVVRLGLGREDSAVADLRRYLELDPDAPDAPRVRQFLAAGALAASPEAAGIPADRELQPRTAFLAGTLIPGGGQFYTQRPRLGTAVLAGAGGALLVGSLYQRITIHCLDAAATRCPEELVASRESRRPLLGPAAGLAAAVVLVGALEAMLHARRTPGLSEPSPAGSADASPALTVGVIGYDGYGLRVELVRLQF